MKPFEVYWSWTAWGLPFAFAADPGFGRYNLAVLGLHVEFGRC